MTGKVQFRNMPVTRELFSKMDVQEVLNLKQLKSKLVAKAVVKALRIDRMNQIYRETGDTVGVAFIDNVLEQLNIQYHVREEDLKHIPVNGSFILVGNHPYGGIDGLILMSILLKKRPDFKMMVNYMLQQFPEIMDSSILVDPFEKHSRSGLNMKSLRKSLHLLKEGTPVGIFPAGEVSSFQLEKFRISDKQWHPVVGKLIAKAAVPVVPVYFTGHNSFLFQLMGVINPHLRTTRLPSELFNKKDVIQVRIGKPVMPATIKSFQDTDQLLRFLRAKTYSLGTALDVKTFFTTPRIRNRIAEPIIDATPVENMKKEVTALQDQDALLVKYNQFSVFVASSLQIPSILREISRLREITFREVGEGTNLSCDTDEYDVYYKHLFVWDHQKERIAGAYRIGEGAKLFARYGKKGFYLNQLFKFKKEFNPVFEKSLELGRSFVVKDYQRNPFSLLLLWKGIYAFVRANPDIDTLIGPVSISNSYTKLSKDLMVHYIRKNHFDSELSKYVGPRKQYRLALKGESKGFKHTEINELNFMDQLISDIEPDQSKVPVLLKKYLSQHGKIIAFNVDPEFNDSLDGLLVMRLKDVPDSAFNMLQ